MKRFISLGMVFLTGCASIAHGPRQSVFLDSSPTNAEVFISGKKGTIKAVTPATVSLKRSSDYMVRFEKDGYVPQTQQISHTMDGWMVGNVFLVWFALIGGVVDLATGSMWHLTPNQMYANLSKQEQPIAQAKEAQQ